jgi:hypothetical protein
MVSEVGVVARLVQLFSIACFLALPSASMLQPTPQETVCTYVNAVHCYLRNIPEGEFRSIRWKRVI